MQGRPPEAAPDQARSSFQVDRSKSTSTAAAYDARQRSASVADSHTQHRHGLGDALTRAANLLVPHRKKSEGPTSSDPAAGNNVNRNAPPDAVGANGTGPYGSHGPIPLGRTSTFRLRTPVISGSTTASPAPSPVPQLRALESYNARNVAAALDPSLQTRQTDDVWQQVCIRVLPLL